jgi:hypothetical protein
MPRINLLPPFRGGTVDEFRLWINRQLQIIVDSLSQGFGSDDIIDGSIKLSDFFSGLVIPDSMLSSLTADKLTEGRLEDGYLLAGNIRTGEAPHGRVVFDSSGLYLYQTDGNLKFHLNPILNSVYHKGDTPDIQVFTANGTWVKPYGARWIEAYVQAGGGGGGAADGAAGQVAAAGGGGGGGFCFKKYTDVELGTSETVVVGAGGTAGATPGGNGGTGGNSTLSGQTANGGVGGIGGGSTASDAPGNNGSAGGAASGGDLNIPGGDGGWGLRFGVIGQGIGGFGGVSHLGGSIRSSGPTGAAGATGKNYGGGGGGGIADNATDRAGGAGAPGIVIAITFF